MCLVTDCIAPFPLQKSPPAALGVAQMFQIIRFCGFRYVAACVMLCRTRIGVLLGRALAVLFLFVSPTDCISPFTTPEKASGGAGRCSNVSDY